MRLERTIRFVLVMALICLGGCQSEEVPAPPPPSKSEGRIASKEGNGRVPGALHYRVNAAQSRFLAQVDVGGLFAAAGHPHTIAIRDFGGEVQVGPGALESASLRVTARTGSLAEVGKEFSEK